MVVEVGCGDIAVVAAVPAVVVTSGWPVDVGLTTTAAEVAVVVAEGVALPLVDCGLGVAGAAAGVGETPVVAEATGDAEGVLAAGVA